MPDGISIIVCTYNGAQRLPATLRHLACQSIPDGMQWELIVVDNASTDGSAEVARTVWPKEHEAKLTILYEPKPGLSHARKCGMGVTKYSVMALVDDDNWLNPDWLRTAVQVMKEHPEVGAIGGYSEAVFELPPPAWFPDFAHAYAVGSQGTASGYVSPNRGYLFGAGLVLRRAAWDQISDGYPALLTGRTGGALTAGEDHELCMAIRLAGWKLWYEQEMRLKHYMPAGRLEWRYLRKVYRGFGAAGPGIAPYRALVGEPCVSQSWWTAAAMALVETVKWRSRHLRMARPSEGSFPQLRGDASWGRFHELLRLRNRYNQSFEKVSVFKRHLEEQAERLLTRDARHTT